MSTWSSLSPAAQAKATTLYQALLSFWNNPSGVSALMGNIWHESAGTFDGRIVQSYTEADLDGFCQDYTDDVNDGTISESQFVNGGPGGGGYGLCQWTYSSRKQGLYDYNISSGTNNIGDNTMQTEYTESLRRWTVLEFTMQHLAGLQAKKVTWRAYTSILNLLK
jgi:hypothetical protein